MSLIQNETVTDTTVDEAATDVAAPKKAKKAKAAKEPKAPREPKVPKVPKVKAPGLADKFIKVLVQPADSGLREGTGRYQFLAAAADATKVGDILGMEFQVGDKTVKLNGSNITGMFSRGHIALSADGESWEKMSIEKVAA